MKHDDIHLGIGERQRVSQAFPERQIGEWGSQFAGFGLVSYRTHGYTESSSPDYMLTIVDRGADALASTGQIGPGLAEALKAEARRRVPGHEFFGHINYTSLIAAKPA